MKSITGVPKSALTLSALLLIVTLLGSPSATQAAVITVNADCFARRCH